MEGHVLFQKFCKKVLGKVDYKLVGAAIVAHKRIWNSGILHPYPRVRETLIELKKRGFKLGIVSDATSIHVYERLYGMGIVNFFDVVVSHTDTHRYKPAKKNFHLAISRLKLKPENCIMVGDWIKGDIIGARKMGLISCLAKYGEIKDYEKKLSDKEHLKNYKTKPDFVLNYFQDILKVIDKLN